MPIQYTQPLTGPTGRVRRYASNGSSGGGVTFGVKNPLIGDLSLDGDEYWALLPGSWVAIGLNPDPAIANGRYYHVAYRRMTDGVTNGPGREVLSSSWLNGATFASLSADPQWDFAYASNHLGLYLPYAGRVFAPDELITMTWTTGLNSQVWSLEWLTAPTAEELEPFLP